MTSWRCAVPGTLVVVLGAALLAGGTGLLLQPPTLAVPDAGTLPDAAPSATAAPVTATAPPEQLVPVPVEQPAQPTLAPPAVLRVPAAGVVTPVEPVGVHPSGALQLPEEPAVTGWWSAGAMPGAAQGSVVLAGHVDSVDAGAGAMKALVDLDLPAQVQVQDVAGGTLTYELVARRTFAKADLPADLFRRDGPPQLVLVTCGGRFDERRGHYEQNVVLYGVPAQL